ncbi:hypothetical protein BGX27_007033 [Mortierella sp. AM989]|nr:hypothetical protein BGX27_007033 [Mortierella sp. AM989]
MTTHGDDHTTAHARLQRTFSLNLSSTKSRKLKQDQRQRAAPEKYPINNQRLDEFTVRKGFVAPVPYDLNEKPKSTTLDGRKSSIVPLKEPLEIRPMTLSHFIADGAALYFSHVLHPSRIPGRDLFSKIYAMGVLPVLIIAMAIIQWSIGLLVIVINHTRIGAHYYGIFFNDQIALFDETDPDGNDEAIRQLADRTPRKSTYFSYHIANMLLIMSSMSYQRDDKLVAQASKILVNIENETQRNEAKRLLRESEREIDENATREFGMRFTGISELKTLGGPFAGLFYNNDSIVLVFKGTSVLAFNEYLLDVTIQRVDASEYLYGEVHKGFYESLFPDPLPLNWYEESTYDKTNPFKTIMQTIFETARIGKQKTGKPVNLWLTGHSLGGALAALTMARLQMPLKDNIDPLLMEDPVRSAQGQPGTKTVLQEMLARFSDDPDLLVLRDCYSVASPKIGDSTFAEEFGRNQLLFCRESPYKSVYWRIVADKDVVPRLPPACAVDPESGIIRILPFDIGEKSRSWIASEHEEDSKATTVHKHGSKIFHHPPQNPEKHLHSLLDYQHVGQLVKVFNAAKIPVVKPSAFEADLSEGVLRKRKDIQGLMVKLSQVATIWKAQVQDDAESASTTTATTTTTATAKTVTDVDTEQEQQALLTQQMAEDVAKAQELYDFDELSRLRQPGPLESIVLTIPSILSHAPATYQRNLIRGRFHFTSFPGVEFEKRVVDCIDESKTVDVVTSNGTEKVMSNGKDHSVSNGKVKVNVDVAVDVKTKKDEFNQDKPMEAETTLSQTVTVNPREQ